MIFYQLFQVWQTLMQSFVIYSSLDVNDIIWLLNHGNVHGYILHSVCKRNLYIYMKQELNTLDI